MTIKSRLVVLEGDKILDLIPGDTNIHYADLSAIVPKNCHAIVVGAQRKAGTGQIRLYPKDSANYLVSETSSDQFIIPIELNKQRLKYACTVATGDFDVYLFGYWMVWGIEAYLPWD